MTILRYLVYAACLLSTACARHQGGVPENEADEFLRQLTPEEWEQMMARDNPPCELGRAVAMDGWQSWPLSFIKSTLRLPESFRADERPRDGARASWSRADSSLVEVMGLEALGGFATAGPEPQPDPTCVIHVLGRRARVDRLRFVRADRSDASYLAFVTTIPRTGEGLAASVLTRTAAGRDSLLSAIAAIAPTAQ